jgi:hypothetical protein
MISGNESTSTRALRLFATPIATEVGIEFDGLTVERGTTYGDDDSTLRRVFELVYCEACGEEFVGGRRGENTSRPGAPVEFLPASPELEKLPEVGGDGNYEDLSYEDFAIFWPSSRTPRQGGNDSEAWNEAVLDTRSGVATLGAGNGPGLIQGRIFSLPRRPNGDLGRPGTAGPNCCPACGTDFSGRSQNFRQSPLRNFRTGFAKSSQLVATEVFELLNLTGVQPKAVVFSDSRQDASRAALDIERRHHQDSRRQLLLETLQRISAAPRDSEADLRQNRREAEDRGDEDAVIDLTNRIKALKQLGDIDRIPLRAVVETAPIAGSIVKRQANPLLAEMVRLGIHPTDEAGIEKIPAKVPAGQADAQFDWQHLFTEDGREIILVGAISRGRRWLDQIVSCSVIYVEQISIRQKCSVRQVNMTISLAFLAPGLVKAAVEGRLPRGIGVERLRDAPAEWSRQFETLGLNPR